MQQWLIVFSVVVFFGCKGEQRFTGEVSEVVSQQGIDVPVYDFQNFEKLLSIKDGKARIVNFWATWCKPCVAELPYFELLNSRYKDSEVEVILVSLDLPKHVESKLIPFLKKQNIRSKVVLLDDPNANEWIPKVDKNWSGAIPATIIYKDNNSRFYEQSFTYDELEKELKNIL